MRLSAALDSLNKLPQNTKENLFGKNWHYMRGMRNRIAHGYAVVDPATIRATVIEELPNLISILKKQRTEEVYFPQREIFLSVAPFRRTSPLFNCISQDTFKHMEILQIDTYKRWCRN